MNNPKGRIGSKNYQDYVIRDGKFIGAFEEMYQNIEDPWNHGDATAIQYDLVLLQIRRHGICRDGGRVLDIGCGKGTFTARVREALPRCSITGIDISPTAIRHAEKTYGNRDMEFFPLDIQEEYRKLDTPFNLIIISQLVWYILPRIGEIMDYLVENVLVEGGYLVINQAFYKPQDQTYGMELISTVGDLTGFIKIPPIELLESNRLTNHDAVLLFKKETRSKDHKAG